MCGIAGAFAYKKNAFPIQQEELVKTLRAMILRGPDGSDSWISQNGKVGLAHCRLSIIDLNDNAAQPMISGDGCLRIVFNGEIYNYQALRADLEKKGYLFRTASDTEVLLHLYSEKGQDMVRELRGMFAFALWDESKQGLFLARDCFGIKPLYYADDGYTIRFASQVKAMLAGGGINTTAEPAGHVGFFVWGHVPEPYTLYKEIRALPAGSTLWTDNKGRHKINIFCRISDILSKFAVANPSISREELKERLRFALLDSVKYHLIADVPVGVFLSSGLDSTTLTALASEVVSSGLQTITLGFREYQGTEKDESPLAELVAQHYGTVHQTRWVSASEFQVDIEHLLAAMDQPTVDGVNTYFVSKVAAETGLKTTLSGIGGDEIFKGYPSFKQIPQMVNMLVPMRYIPRVGRGFRWVCAPFLKQFTSPKYAGILEYGNSYGGAYLLRRGLFMPWELPDILDGELVREGWKKLQTLMRLDETICEIESKHLKISALEMEWYMRNQLLRDADWAGMAHSLEIRVPLVDLELLKNIAPLLAGNKPPNKLDMALTPNKSLPDEILCRKKTGFNIPVQKWLHQKEGNIGVEHGLRGWAKTVYKANGTIA